MMSSHIQCLTWFDTGLKMNMEYLKHLGKQAILSVDMCA